VAAAGGDLDAAAVALAEALAEHDLAPIAFERARTLLVLGQVLRRRRERTAAMAAFDEALAVFEQLGARLWAARARQERERVGIRRSTTALTAGERAVAERAASGQTSREIGAALFISPRTVEANLDRIYRKLGIRSRAELGAAMTRDTGRPAD
jgi:DNA-binding CsgD family transcriptional regulator